MASWWLPHPSFVTSSSIGNTTRTMKANSWSVSPMHCAEIQPPTICDTTAVASALATGFVPSVQYIYVKTKAPFAIDSFEQEQVAVSRFLRDVVAGKQPPSRPRLERDEFNRAEGVPDAPYDTLVSPRDATSVVHLFLHDYDDTRILSFCGGTPVIIMTQQDVWSHNKRAIVDYVPQRKDLKLIWESDPKTKRRIAMFPPLSELATADSISFSFGG